MVTMAVMCIAALLFLLITKPIADRREREWQEYLKKYFDDMEYRQRHPRKPPSNDRPKTPKDETGRVLTRQASGKPTDIGD